jgi:hypothetical protein
MFSLAKKHLGGLLEKHKIFTHFDKTCGEKKLYVSFLLCRQKGSHSVPCWCFCEITSSGNLFQLWFAIYCCVVEVDFFLPGSEGTEVGNDTSC